MRRLFCVLLALAALCGMTVFPVRAADGDYQVTVAKIQRLTPGTAFDPDTAPDAANASPGDVLVLTVAFQNNTAAAVDIAGFSTQLQFDKTKVTPCQGTEPFTRKPFQISPALTDADTYGWISASNVKDDFVLVAGGGWNNYSVSPGETLPLVRMAFQVNADASGEAAFTFNGAKTDITPAKGKAPSLAAFQPVRVALEAAPSYEITAVSADRVTLTNSTPVTLAVSHFDADGKFVSVSMQSVPANAGSVSVAFGSAYKGYIMLLDDAFRPLCERCLYVTQ